jgi:AcrR family transcriptional regulator
MSDDARRPPARPIGRPRRSSAEMLADAAAELFLEAGWSGTTVDQIARRAGVSRGTFFNWFEAKSDLFWVDLDESAAGLGDLLRASSGLSPVRAVEAALVGVARAHPADRVPWALTQGDAMGLGDEVVASAAVRGVRLRATVARFLGEAAGRPRGDLGVEVAASALLAAAASAVTAWAGAGVGRAPLADVMAEALGPVADGLDATVAASAGPVAPPGQDPRG